MDNSFGIYRKDGKKFRRSQLDFCFNIFSCFKRGFAYAFLYGVCFIFFVCFNRKWLFFCWLYWGLTWLQRYFSHIPTWKQEITHLWKFKCSGEAENRTRSFCSASQEKTRPTPLPNGKGGNFCVAVALYVSIYVIRLLLKLMRKTR